MPQKHPPAMTAVCSPPFAVFGASTTGPGMATAAAFPAVHATMPPITTRNSRKATAENLNMRDSPGRLAGPHSIRVPRRAKVSSPHVRLYVIHWTLFFAHNRDTKEPEGGDISGSANRSGQAGRKRRLNPGRTRCAGNEYSPSRGQAQYEASNFPLAGSLRQDNSRDFLGFDVAKHAPTPNH